MVWPAVIAAGAALGGALLNQSSSAKSAKARKDELWRMGAIADAIKDPSFDTSQLSPEDFQIVAKYDPELAQSIAEREPELLKAASEGAVKGRSAQMAALDKFRNLSETGDDVQSRLLRGEALREAQLQNQGQQGAIQQSFAQRGMGGATNELVSALLGQQGSQRLAQQASQQSARDAYNTRLGALRDSAELGGRIRGEDIAVEGRNVDAINAFNQRMAQRGNEYQRYLADTRNQAQAQNLNVAQSAADRNVAQRNTAAERAQDARNQSQRDIYNASLGKANVKLGVGGQNIQNINQNQANNASAVNAITGAVIKGADTYMDYEDRKKDREAKYGYME